MSADVANIWDRQEGLHVEVLGPFLVINMPFGDASGFADSLCGGHV